MRGRPLAVRLAVVMAGVVVVVLLAAGIVVNRAASRSLDETLAPREQQRLSLALDVVEQGLERGADGRGMQRLLDQIARESRGRVQVLSPDGSVRLEANRLPPDVQTQTLSNDLSADAGGGSIEITVPSAAAPFVAAFNTALVLIGVVAVAALLAAAAVFSNRLTRPLRELAGAARRLGAGDLTVRAAGGADAESAELAIAFNDMADRLERSEALRRRAASDLAHDLATPATVLESQIQAMVDGVVPADAGQLEKARAAASGLSSVIAQLGELTQAEAAPLQRSVERIPLLELVRETVGGVEALLDESRVRVEVEGVDVATRADRGQLGRAIRNVLVNAIQHSPPDGRVTLEVALGPTIRVIDQGSGIAEEDRPFVFERFYRADRSRGRAGSGIGLTVARELVVANGGTIELEATGADGTSFVIGLPSTS